MQNIKETSETLRGPKVNARKHWDGVRVACRPLGG